MSISPKGVGGIETCHQAVYGLDAIMHGHMPDTPYYLLGGITTATLIDHESRIIPSERLVVAGPDSDLSVRRPNGTPRDADILLLGVLPKETLQNVKAAVLAGSRKSIEVSVFGLDRHVPNAGVGRRMAWNMAQWVSRRTLDTEGNHRYELFPLSCVVQAASYEPWRLVLPGMKDGECISILNPGAHWLAYQMRSIGGLRGKDAEKVEKMGERVEPIFREQIHDGVLREWRLFAESITTMRDEGIILPGNRHPAARPNDLRVGQQKSKLSNWGEGHSGIVDVGQKPGIQRVLNIFVRSS